jgi:3-deoxy-D-manno-octulosonate 8-phosphate phosphatase (KDO 8-P phosphatase)
MIDASLARKIRLVGLDVDGVLTDGGIYLGDVNGERTELKRYDIQDGLGIKFLRDAGIKVVIVTGRVSESVKLRAGELELDDFIQDAAARKLPALRGMLARHGVDVNDVSFIGDDFPDAGILREVGLPACVGNAVPEIRALCKVHLTRQGGRGAAREFAELLLKARGQWDEVTERYIRERSESSHGALA